MNAMNVKKTKMGKWLEERKKQKKIEHIGELKLRNSGHKMDVLNRIKKSVTNVLPGNPLSRDFDIQLQVASAGPGLLWKVFSAVKKSSKEEAAVFLFEKKIIDKLNKKDKDLIIESLRRGVQQLTKLRHPKILSVIHPLEETREALAFATEPVFASLANVLGAHDNIQDPPKFLKEFQLYEVEIKHGLLQVLEGLAFLHNDAKMMHRNVCPTAIALTKTGTWKLSGFEFCQTADNPQDQNPVFGCNEWRSDIPREAQPHLDFMAPEYELMKICSPASDMFSFGVLLYALYNKGKPLYECHGEMSVFRRKAEELSSVRGALGKSIPQELVDHVKLLLNIEQAIRPDANQIAKVSFFEDMACVALQYVDSLFQRENMEKSNFFKGLPKVIEKLPKRVNQQRILPAIFKEGVNSTMVPFILPSIFLVAEQSTDGEYRTMILPHIIPYFKMKEPIQVMLMLLQNMNILLSKTPAPQIQAYVLPLVFSALEAESPQIQELCLNIIPTFADLIEYSTLKSSLVPRIKKLCLGTSVLNVRVNALICMAKLMDQMDKWFVLDEILPFLREIPTREPAVLMSILGIHKIALTDSKLGITKDVMASKVLPFLIPLCIDNNLNLSQFSAYISVVKEMLGKVETEHRTKLEQLEQIQHEHKTLEIGQITGEIGDSNQAKSSFMDKFMSGVGLGSFTSSASLSIKKPSASQANGSTSSLVTSEVSDDGSIPQKKTTLTMEEKQRLAKQQEQEKALKAQRALVPESTNKPMNASIASNVPKSSSTLTSNPSSSSGPRDLTSTLMQSNMNSLRSNSPAARNSPMTGSASSLTPGGGGINWQSSGAAAPGSVNWGSAPSSNTSSAYTTPRSTPPAMFDSSASKKPNVDFSSFDNLLAPGSSAGRRMPLNQMSHSQPVIGASMMGQPQQPPAMNAFVRPGGMGVNAQPQWGNQGFSGPGSFQQVQPMNMGSFPMYNNSNNTPMMMSQPQQGPMANTMGMQMQGAGAMAPNSNQAKPLSNDDLKDLLG